MTADYNIALITIAGVNTLLTFVGIFYIYFRSVSPNGCCCVGGGNAKGDGGKLGKKTKTQVQPQPAPLEGVVIADEMKPLLTQRSTALATNPDVAAMSSNLYVQKKIQAQIDKKIKKENFKNI